MHWNWTPGLDWLREILDLADSLGATRRDCSLHDNRARLNAGSFVVFTFGSLLVAIQVASGQIVSGGSSPRPCCVMTSSSTLLVAIHVQRAVADDFADRIATTVACVITSSNTVGLFIFSLLFALSALDRMQSTVHQTVAFIAAILGILSFNAFFYLIDYAARMLRPISILTRVSTAGLGVIDIVYPGPSTRT